MLYLHNYMFNRNYILYIYKYIYLYIIIYYIYSSNNVLILRGTLLQYVKEILPAGCIFK